MTFIIPQVEMGQGMYTSMSMIVAEELDADWNRVRVEHAPANQKLYVNPMIGVQVTATRIRSARSGSRCVRPVRRRAHALVEAAARSWKVPAAECRTEEGKVIHDAHGPHARLRRAGRPAPRRITPPKDVPLKDAAEFRLIGRPLKRLDTPDKTNGGRNTASMRGRPASRSRRSPRVPCSAARSERGRSTRARQFPVCARS